MTDLDTYTPSADGGESERERYDAKKVPDGYAKRTLNVYQRYSKACEIIDSMPWAKDQSNPQYKSVPIDAMRAGVRKACIQAGLAHKGPDDLEVTRDRNDRTVRFYATCTFSLINVDNPDERIVFTSAGESMDNGDKGTSKVVSNLIKNFYKAAFDIGEQSKDDIDSYSNEEIYAEADRIEANRRKMLNTSKDDPFFSGKKRESKPPSSDRDPVQMTDTVVKAMNRGVPGVKEAVMAYREKYGIAMSKWDPSIIAELYDQVIGICKEQEVSE